MTKRTRLTDAQGFTWNVHEVTQKGRTLETADGGVTRSRESSLYFFSRYATKKLSRYPANWTELTAAELEQLREQALPLTGSWPSYVGLADYGAAIELWDEQSGIAAAVLPGMQGQGPELPTCSGPDVPPLAHPDGA